MCARSVIATKALIVFTRAAMASISGRKRQVEEQHLVFGVVGDPHDLVRMQARVERVQHRARARHRVVQLHVAIAVPRQRRDAVAEARRRARRARWPCGARGGEVAVGVAVDVALDAARHDLAARRGGARRASAARRSAAAAASSIRSWCSPTGEDGAASGRARATAPRGAPVGPTARVRRVRHRLRRCARRAGRPAPPRRPKAGIAASAVSRPNDVRQQAGDERAGGQAEQVLEQRQHRRAGGAHAGVDRRRSRSPTPGRRCRSSRSRRATISANCAWADNASPRCARRRRGQQRQRRPGTAAPSPQLARAAGARRRGRPRRPRRRCRRRRPAPPARPSRRPAPARCRARGSGSSAATTRRAETTISCAAPPRQTHSMVRERASARTMWRAALASACAVARSSAGVSATVR